MTCEHCTMGMRTSGKMAWWQGADYVDGVRSASIQAGECPDYGSMGCPKTVPGAEYGVDMQYANELMQAKCRYYARRAKR